MKIKLITLSVVLASASLATHSVAYAGSGEASAQVKLTAQMNASQPQDIEVKILNNLDYATEISYGLYHIYSDPKFVAWNVQKDLSMYSTYLDKNAVQILGANGSDLSGMTSISVIFTSTKAVSINGNIDAYQLDLMYPKDSNSSAVKVVDSASIPSDLYNNLSDDQFNRFAGETINVSTPSYNISKIQANGSIFVPFAFGFILGADKVPAQPTPQDDLVTTLTATVKATF